MTKQSLESSPSISGSTGNEPVNCTACELDEFLCNLAEGYLPCVSSELCTSSPELEAGFLPTYYSDTNRSVQLKSMSIASKSYRRGKQTVLFHGFPSLQMSQNLMDDRGAVLLMSFVADSLAKTSVLPETVPDWTAKGQGYGQKWLGLLGRYDPDTHSLKTAQLSLLEDSTGCCPTLPRFGLMLDGELYQQPMLEPFTVESAFGYWPTPTVCGNYNRPGASATSGMGLATAVKLWPTPTASASNGSSQNSLTRKDGRDRSGDRLDYAVMALENGRLNPEFCEWLMGWPIGHTDLKPLATGRFQEWWQQHGSCFMDESQ